MIIIPCELKRILSTPTWQFTSTDEILIWWYWRSFYATRNNNQTALLLFLIIWLGAKIQ